MSYRIAGIDVHKKILAVVVSDVEIESEYQFERRMFSSNPEQLRSLATWLVEQKAEEIVMESTAQYWKPVWETLERYWKPLCEKREGARRRSGTLHLAQALSNRGRRGRKMDFVDAERLVKRLVARARITVRWICAFALRCRTGPNSSGSIRARRASVRASCQSSFRLLLVINSTFCACATIPACPNSVNTRLTHGEFVPVSRAIRLRGIFPNVCFIASGVVATFCSRMILPASSKTQ